MSEARWGERRRARFTPTRTDDLQHDGPTLVGRVIEWEFAGTMDEGPYDGQAIWTPVDTGLRSGWVPDEDLTDVDDTPGS